MSNSIQKLPLRVRVIFKITIEIPLNICVVKIHDFVLKHYSVILTQTKN